MTILKRILVNIGFSFFVSLLLFIINWIVIPMSFNLQNLIHRDNFLIIFLIIFAGTFIRSKKAIIGYYVFLLFFVAIEILHLAYYGNVVYASEIWIFFNQFAEVSDGLFTFETLKLFTIPFLLLIVAVPLVIFTLNKFKNKFISVKYFQYLIISSFLLWALNIYITQNNTGIKPPIDQHILRSGLESFFGFFGKVLPKKLKQKDYSYARYKAHQPVKNQNANIVLIIGESLNPNKMSLFGYNVNTTPKLDLLYQENIIEKTKAYSYGVCTFTSLAGIFNITDSIGQEELIFSQNNSLFKLAKNNDFSTYYISAQSTEGVSHIYNILAPRYIDKYKTASQINTELNNRQACYDISLLDEIKKIDFKKSKNFIVLQMIGSHENYKERTPEHMLVFDEKDYKNKKDYYYDNSVHYTDMVLTKIIKYLQMLDAPVYFIFMSDHSEMVNNKGRYGHCTLNEEVYTVPVVYASFNTADTLKFNNFTTAHNISVDISRLLGYNFATYKNYIFVCGIELDGSAGYKKVFLNTGAVLK